MTTDAPLALGGEFPTPARDEWLGLVDKVLKGGSFDRLVSTSYDGIEIQPLYTAGDVALVDEYPGQPGYSRGRSAAGNIGGAWDIRQTHSHPDPATANRQILEDLEGGVTSLALRLDVGGVGEVDGIIVSSRDDLGAALDGVLLDLAPVSLEAGSAFSDAANWLGELCEHLGVGPEQISGSLGADPLGVLAATGRLPQGLDTALAEMVDLAKRCHRGHRRLTAAVIDTAAYSDAGASEGQELAVVLATAAAYLRALVHGGLGVVDAADQISVILTAETDVFMTIAKNRALRRCWDYLVEAAAGEGASDDAATGAPVRISARTANRIMSRRDPWVNMLRTTAACFAAGVSGVESITVQPFDAALGLPGDLGRRLARNTQLLLQEESHIGRVIDPAGGSWYLESLTDSLCATAWATFLRIEAAGGMADALATGLIATEIAAVHSARAKNVATRRDPLTGVSEFPNLAEEPVAVDATDREALRSRARARTLDLITPEWPATEIEPLPAHRLSEGFEALRDASDARLAATGARPRVFLANLGPAAEHTARATFAKNFFEAGGIEGVGTGGFADDDSLIAAFGDSGATMAVICSSDRTYADRAASCAAALREAKATRIYLAGKPGDQRAEWESSGVDEFIHVGVDAIDVLQRAHDIVEVAS